MCVWLWSNHSFLHFIHFSLKKLLLIGLLFDWRNHDFILTESTTEEESIPFDFHALWHQVKKSKSQGTLKRYDTRKSWGRGEKEGGDRHYHPSVPFFLVKFLLSLLCFYTIFEALTFLADHVVDWQVYVEKKKERRRWTMTLVDSTERNFFLLFFVTSSLSVNHMCDEIQEPKWFYSPFNPFKNLFSPFFPLQDCLTLLWQSIYCQVFSVSANIIISMVCYLWQERRETLNNWSYLCSILWSTLYSPPAHYYHHHHDWSLLKRIIRQQIDAFSSFFS